MISGHKITLRPVTIADLPFVIQWENNPELWLITEHDGPLSESSVREFIINSSDMYLDQQLRLIIQNETGDAIGALDIFDYDPFLKSGGLGILIADKINRGKGYAQDALSAFLRYQQGRREVIHLRCLIHNDNAASIALFLRNGFEKKGTKYFKGKEATQYTLDI